MSMFSSLNYFLKRASVAVRHAELSTEPSDNLFLKESKFSSKSSPFVKNESVAVNATSYSRYMNILTGTGEIINSFNTSTSQNGSNFIDLDTSVALLEVGDKFTSESNAKFSNETFANADLLFENWWNIFDERYMRHGWGWTVTLTVAYLLILVVGVIGNVMVILVVLLRPKMRSVTNMFIMNLAVADLFVIVFCVPSTLLANIFAPWILGSFMCKAVAYVQGVSVCASAYSLAAISLDRCQAIYRNYERPRGFSQTICVRTVFIIWIAAMSLTIPWAVIFEVKVSEYDGLRYCVETWQVEQHGNIYFIVVNLFCFYAIPLLLIFVSNWIIYCHVSHRKVPQDSASAAPIRKLHRQTRHDVLRMLGIVTFIYLFSWLPLYILVIRIKFSENISHSEYNVLQILMPMSQWLGSWNSSINPVLYAFLNKKFRRMFKSILPAWFLRNLTGQYQGSSGTTTPSLTTTVYTGKSIIRSRANSRNDYNRNHRNTHILLHNQANLLISRFHEQTGTVKTTTAETPTTKPKAIQVYSCGDTAVVKSTKIEIITDL